MKAIKLIVTDLDNTLLDGNSLIPAETADFLQRLMESGVKFTFATGRHPKFTRHFVREMGITIPIICANGGVIFDPIEQRSLFATLFEPDFVQQVSEYLFANGFPFAYHTDECIFMTYDNPRRQFLDAYNAAAKNPEDQSPVGLLEPGHSPNGVFKISVFCGKNRALKNELPTILPMDNIQLAFSGEGVLDLYTDDSGKGNALRRLAKYLHLDLEETIAFGDNDNDLEMIRIAGHGVAVGNAIPEMRRAAEFVTLSNREQGVMYALSTRYKDFLPSRV